MSKIDILKSLGAKGKPAKKKDVKNTIVEWGSLEYIKRVGIDKMSRRDLRNHLEARDLNAIGSRLELRERLMASVQEEELASLAYTDTMDTEFLVQADLEERGACYSIGFILYFLGGDEDLINDDICVGTNSSGQLGLGDMGESYFCDKYK